MPGFDSLASQIAGGYNQSHDEDTVDSTNRNQNQNQDPKDPKDTTTSSTATYRTEKTELPFGFTKAEDAATGGPECIPALGGTTASSSDATNCCTKCTILVEQENAAKKSVCDTMKARVEAWFADNGCPIQITSLLNTDGSNNCGCTATGTATNTNTATNTPDTGGAWDCAGDFCVKRKHD